MMSCDITIVVMNHRNNNLKKTIVCRDENIVALIEDNFDTKFLINGGKNIEDTCFHIFCTGSCYVLLSLFILILSRICKRMEAEKQDFKSGQ